MITKSFNIQELEEQMLISEKVINYYVHQLMGLSEVAARTGININTIRKILKDNNIELRKRNFRR